MRKNIKKFWINSFAFYFMIGSVYPGFRPYLKNLSYLSNFSSIHMPHNSFLYKKNQGANKVNVNAGVKVFRPVTDFRL